MLFAPTLALLAIVFNFCAVIHVANRRNNRTTSRWFTIEDIIDGTTVKASKNYLDIVTPPPPTSPPVYSSVLRRAEWAYRSSAVRILDLVDGHGPRVRTVSDIAPPPLFSSSSPSPTKPTDPVASVGSFPPTLTSPIHPATFEQFPTYDPSTPPVIASPVAQSLGLAGWLSCLVYALIFIVLRNRRLRQFVSTPRPILKLDVNCQTPVEDFRSVYTATPIPSYAGSEVDFIESESKDSSGPSRNSRVDYPTTPRTFPVVITNSNGQALFNAEIKLSSNHVVTELSATTSTVSFSIDVIASLDVPTVSEWYMPAKEDGDASAQSDGSAFLLLVRGLSDRLPLDEESQDPGRSSDPEDTALSADNTPESNTQTLFSAHEAEDTGPREVTPLGSPMCPVTIPIHYRGFSSFETALINSGTKARMANAHKGCSHRRDKSRANTRPRDVRFSWLKDIYTCGDDHLDGCVCEVTLAEDALRDQFPPPHVLSKVFDDYDANLEFDRDTHSEERGSGIGKRAYTVSSSSSVRSEMPPTSISGPAELRPTAHSDPSPADGEELAGLDSTVALMPSFSVDSPELSSRCRSSGISTPVEYADGSLGERSMSLEEDDIAMGLTGEFTGMTRFGNGIRSPPSPVVPAQAGLLLDALRPVLADYTPSPSPEEVALEHPSSAFDYPGNSPLQYSPSDAGSPVNRLVTPECDEWVGESAGAVDGVDSEPVSEVES